MHRVIVFNQTTRIKPYIDMNTEFIKEAKKDFGNDFLSC